MSSSSRPGTGVTANTALVEQLVAMGLGLSLLLPRWASPLGPAVRPKIRLQRAPPLAARAPTNVAPACTGPLTLGILSPLRSSYGSSGVLRNRQPRGPRGDEYVFAFRRVRLIPDTCFACVLRLS